MYFVEHFRSTHRRSQLHAPGDKDNARPHCSICANAAADLHAARRLSAWKPCSARHQKAVVPYAKVTSRVWAPRTCTDIQTHHNQRACLQLKAPRSMVDVGEAVVLEAAQHLACTRPSLQRSALLPQPGPLSS